jgi:AGCS family alanine or glycine:cation symporter
MRKILLLLIFLPNQSFAQANWDQKINDLFAPATNYISEIVFYSIPFNDTLKVPLILIWLLLAGLFFTFYLKGINISYFKHAVNVTRGCYDKPKEKGEVSHFQALSAALSGTLGLGNISGVAIAVSLGGPGATFWMIIAGLIGMCSKFVECTLGVKYRDLDEKGVVSGGPMYYLSKAFAQRNWPTLGKFFAAFFALMCIGGSLGGGNMFQSNQASRVIIHVTENEFLSNNIWILGLIMAILVGIVIVGGIKSIARVAEFLVPFMCGIYLLAGIAILVLNYSLIPPAFSSIFSEAFSAPSIQGGMLGVMLQGFQRASFSNEAGIGSASIAHSAVKTDEPITEGMVGLLEPLIDTVVVCTMTALVIVITGYYKVPATDGIAITSRAFGSVICWFPYVLAVAVFLFAYATMLSWSYYGSKSWTYLFGPSKLSDHSFKILFCLFIIIGASMDLKNVVVFSDAMIFAMSLPNIIGLYLLAPEVKKDLKMYISKLKSGEIEKLK